MKKIVVLFSVLCLCVSMIGCGNKKEEERIAELEERIAELEAESGSEELDFGSLYDANDDYSSDYSDDGHEPFEIPDDYDGDVEILERIDPNESNEVESVIFNLNEPFSADGYFEMNAVLAEAVSFVILLVPAVVFVIRNRKTKVIDVKNSLELTNENIAEEI